MRITDFEMISEVRSEYMRLRQEGFGRTVATEEMQKLYHDERTLGAEDDGILFWIGLADAQYALREISQEVAHQGLLALEKIAQLDWQVTPGDIKRRKEHYLSAPMPERKKVAKPRKFRCTWQLGDTFAYQLSGPEAQASGLLGRYVLLRKVDELEFGDGRLLPVVTVTLWDDTPLPKNADEFQKVPMLKLDSGRLGTSRSQYEYRTEMIIRSAGQLAKLQLKYLGNFAEVPMPENEVIIRHPGMVMMLIPEYIDRDCCVFWKLHCYYTQQNSE